MKRKILYIITTAIIGVATFSVGKNFSTTQPETVYLEETQTPRILWK